MPAALRVGLTGGIASGKTTVGQRFIELGVPLIDADVVSRIVVEPGKPGLARVLERFGKGVLNADGTLNRAAMRERIFERPAERQALQEILHPLIRAEMEAQAAQVTAPYLVMAIPLLLESGAPHDRVDRVLVVDVPQATQVSRLVARDHTSIEQARAILASQATRADRLAAADEVIENIGTVTELRQAVDLMHQRYLHMTRGRI